MFAGVEIEKCLHTSNVSETLKSRNFYPYNTFKSFYSKTQNSRLYACLVGWTLKKTVNDPSYGVEVLDSRQLTPNTKRRSGNFMSAANSGTQQENHGSSIYHLKPRALLNLHSYNILTLSKYQNQVMMVTCVCQTGPRSITRNN